ncbi:MAG TPA: hypothetical protein VL860_10660, partial [Planctomycetota bacterium]|nr:hypothetical protein [Planctomycetota bacterium]
MSLERFEELKERMEAGLATDTDQRELAALLEADPLLRRRLVEHALEEVQLRKVLTGAADEPVRPAPTPIWRMAVWSAAAALFLCAAGYALWQMEAAPTTAPQQGVAPLPPHPVEVVTAPPVTPPQDVGTPVLVAGKLLVDGVENGP